MAGNSFGHMFRITTFGESHGQALGVIIDGCPPGIFISKKDIQDELDRRKPGNFIGTTSRKEPDEFEILSGTVIPDGTHEALRQGSGQAPRSASSLPATAPDVVIPDGKVASATAPDQESIERTTITKNDSIFQTLGTPIAIIIYNKEQKSTDYSALKNIYRPGHADFTYTMKYGIHDHRGGGRSSGRETVARVITGAFAKKILEPHHIKIIGHTIQIGHIKAAVIPDGKVASGDRSRSGIYKNPLRCADNIAAQKMAQLIKKAQKAGDSLGGIVEITVKNPPIGLGEPVFDKLEADLAKALMSIGTVKGIEFGNGFSCATRKGSENNDPFISKNGKIAFAKNDAGGILGGISTGQDIIMRIAVKPPSSIAKTQKTVTHDGKTTEIAIQGRHDACIIPRLIPVAEAMTAMTLADHLLRLKSIR